MNYPGKVIPLSLLNVSELSRDLDISRQTVYNIWNGINRPSVDLAFQVVELLQMSRNFVDVYAKSVSCRDQLKELLDNKYINMFTIWY